MYTQFLRVEGITIKCHKFTTLKRSPNLYDLESIVFIAESMKFAFLFGALTQAR